MGLLLSILAFSSLSSSTLISLGPSEDETRRET